MLIFSSPRGKSRSVRRLPCNSPTPRGRENHRGETKRPRFAGWLIVFLSAATLSIAERALWAETVSPCCAQSLETSPPPPPFWSNRGRWNFGAQVGFALENAIPRNISHVAILVAQPQLGFIVLDFKRSPVRRFEVISEGILGNAVHPGGRLTGYALLFRLDGKNYKRAVPFFDTGGGVQNTTLYKRAPELSGAVQFSPQAGLGIQYFFNPQRALVFEYRYMHMSNAGIQSPNHGFNGSMLSVGFRWLRRPRSAGSGPPLRSRNLFRSLFGAD